MKIAVVADPHYHDIHGEFGRTGGAMALRTFADTVASTRVFNESFNAFRTVLAQLAQAGIEIVVIVGDLTDDGQAANVRSVGALLSSYEKHFGMRFFMTPGNHDLYAIHGRHQSKRFLNPDGSHTLVTSDPAVPQGDSVTRIVTAEMYCAGHRHGLPPLSGYGFRRDPRDLLWESPFGPDDDFSARLFEIRSADGLIRRRMIDASFLVEPIEGLWLLSLDANVFEPRNGADDPVPEASYHDSTDAGWNAMLRHKRFVLEWASWVAARARAEGKHLLAFSHYPMIDPMHGTFEDEALLVKNSSFARRAPRASTVAAAIGSGIGVHFSGHLHVNGTVRVNEGESFLVNVAVPSLVAFPAAYKLVSFAEGGMEIETVTVDKVAGHDVAFAAYRLEARRTDADISALEHVRDHAGFLLAHQRLLVRHRHLSEEWHEEVAALADRLTVGDLRRVAGLPDLPSSEAGSAVNRGSAGTGIAALPFFEAIVDWYLLRKGTELARAVLAPERLTAYRELAEAFRRRQWEPDSVQAKLAAFFRLFTAYVGGQPSDAFRIDLATGAVTSCAHLGRTERRQIGSASK